MALGTRVPRRFGGWPLGMAEWLLKSKTSPPPKKTGVSDFKRTQWLEAGVGDPLPARACTFSSPSVLWAAAGI